MASLMKGLKRKDPKETEKLAEEDPRLAEGVEEIKRLKSTLSVYGEQLTQAEEELAQEKTETAKTKRRLEVFKM